jgi:hypothetical protein
MHIYIFASDENKSLQAFAGDAEGSRLPDQFRPWRAIGEVGPDKAPPHRLPRKEIERAIGDQGFQLWRVKPKVAAD